MSNGVTFNYKDYRVEGPERYKVMTLATDEFIRRFLLHVLPKGFHRIRHYGLLANTGRAENIAGPRAARVLPRRPQAPVKKTRRKSYGLAAMPVLRRAHDRHRGLRSRNAAAIARAIPAVIWIDTS